MCYIQNKDFKVILKSVEEVELFIKVVIGVLVIKFKSYIYFLELLFFFLRICYNFLLYCLMFISIKDDFKGIF